VISPLLLAAVVTNAAPAAINPLEPALTGQLQCYEPNEEKKTCRALGSYKRVSGSRYMNGALALISAVGPVTLEMTTPVEVKAGAVCGTIRPEDVSNGKLAAGGRPLSAAEAAPVLAQIAQAMAPMMNKEICTRYVPDAGGLIGKATIGGVYRADADRRVKWVKATDRYTVAP
jgi:hypothetical protein